MEQVRAHRGLPDCRFSEGTRIRLGEGRSVTVVEPLDEIMDRLNKTNQQPEG